MGQHVYCCDRSGVEAASVTEEPDQKRQQAARWPPHGPARVLVVLDRVALTELVKLTLNHGVYTTRTVATLSEVTTTVDRWRPHLLILDMDLDGREVLENIGANTAKQPRLPVI